MSRLAYLATLQARLGKEKAHQKELAKAAAIGGHTHGYIEWTLRRERGELAGPEPRISDKALWAFRVWQDWQASVKLLPLALEQLVWSTTHPLCRDARLPRRDHRARPGRGRPRRGRHQDRQGDLRRGAPPGERLRDRLAGDGPRAAGREGRRGPTAEGRDGPGAGDPADSPEEQAELFATFLHVQAPWNWQQGQRAAATEPVR